MQSVIGATPVVRERLRLPLAASVVQSETKKGLVKSVETRDRKVEIDYSDRSEK